MTDISPAKNPLDRTRLVMFSDEELQMVNDTVSTAEELVSDYYKMSASQWQRLKYDIKTLRQLQDDEIVHGPFAQVIRYEAKRKDAALGSAAYDFYKICLQDHAILGAIRQYPELRLSPFCLYIVAHELIHIVRFGRFLQNFDASEDEKMAEEIRVHQNTREILSPLQMPGKKAVFRFYHQWCGNCDPLDMIR
jgi:hypothetical protein